MRFTENASERVMNEASALMAEISALPDAELASFDSYKTLAVFVDIINGFINEGAMASERIGDIIAPSAELLRKCNEAGMMTAAFADCHESYAAEFSSFPPHCINRTRESEVVDELQAVGGYILIPKNSTNGFHEDRFRDMLDCHPELSTFIVAGDCSDICVMQFCLALKTYFTRNDVNVRIVVPLSCIETYDAPYHSSDFMNLAAYKLMKDSGIEFVNNII